MSVSIADVLPEGADPAKFLDDLLVNSIEGGSIYWLAHFRADEGPRCANAINSYDTLFRDGRGAAVWDDEGEKHRLDRAKAEAGLVALCERYPHHARDVKADNCDADTADAWLQMAVLGEIVYG